MDIVKYAVSILQKEGVVVCPTDTIYGLIADATNEKAIRKIFSIKKRSKKKPLGIFVENLAMAKKFARISKVQERFLKKVWPGKVSVVLESKGKLPKTLGATKTIGIRIPKHDLILSLIKKLGHPLAQTSVNISNEPSLIRVQDIRNVFSQKTYRPDYIIDAGILPKSAPSKVLDYTGKTIKIVRP